MSLGCKLGPQSRAKPSQQRWPPGWKGARAGCPCPQGPSQPGGCTSAVRLFRGCRFKCISVTTLSVTRQRDGSAAVLRSCYVLQRKPGGCQALCHVWEQKARFRVVRHHDQVFPHRACFSVTSHYFNLMMPASLTVVLCKEQGHEPQELGLVQRVVS